MSELDQIERQFKELKHDLKNFLGKLKVENEQLQQENENLKQELEKIKEIIKIDIEYDNMTLQEFSKMSYFSLSPKGKVLQNILNTIMKRAK